jgi:hypothetical protein
LVTIPNYNNDAYRNEKGFTEGAGKVNFEVNNIQAAHLLGHQEGNDENRFHGSPIEALVLKMTTVGPPSSVLLKVKPLVGPRRDNVGPTFTSIIFYFS